MQELKSQTPPPQTPLGTKRRMQFFLEQVRANRQLWILSDEHGAVMLTSEDEDCVPVWPDREFAESWATDEWDHCQPKAIPLQHWLDKWTPGLEEDELMLAVFPTEDDDGTILFPDELAFQLD